MIKITSNKLLDLSANSDKSPKFSRFHLDIFNAFLKLMDKSIFVFISILHILMLKQLYTIRFL